MSMYRTWLINRGEQISGPFPEPYICEQILIGRIREDDMLSLDGHAWHSYRDIAEIVAEIGRLLDSGRISDNPAWGEERVRATMRRIDERKRPDRRAMEDVDVAGQPHVWQSRRQGSERRQSSETVEQHTYRQMLTDVDRWLRQHRLRNGWAIAVLLVFAVLVGLTLNHFQAVTPIYIGLKPAKHACNLAPAKDVDWHGCDKSGYLLAGADLRNANLAGINFAGANLSYADFSGAEMSGAQLNGAILTGARWMDGRICATGSVGECR